MVKGFTPNYFPESYENCYYNDIYAFAITITSLLQFITDSELKNEIEVIIKKIKSKQKTSCKIYDCLTL